MTEFTRNPYLLLLTSTIASFTTPFISTAIGIVLPAIGDEFKLTTASVNWVATSFLISLASTIYLIGRVADIFGRGKVFLLGLIVFSATSYSIYVTDDYALLLVLRALQGFGSAMISGTAVAILTDAFPRHLRGRVIGINTAAVYVGTALGPFLGGIITGNYGWRLIFLFIASVSLISTLLVPLSVDMGRAGNVQSDISYVKSAVFTASIALIIYGTSTISTSRYSPIALAAGTVLITALFTNESQSPGPRRLFPRPMLRRAFLTVNLVALLNYSATYAISILLSVYLQRTYGLPPQLVGTLLVTQSVLQALLSPAAGYLADRYSPLLIASVGMSLIPIGIASLIVSLHRFTYALLITSLAILGVGFALFASPSTTAIMSMTHREVYSSAAAFLATMRFTGQALSAAVITAVMSLVSDLTLSVVTCLYIYVVLGVLGAVLSFTSLKVTLKA